MLLALANQLRCLLVGLTISLAIGGVESIGQKGAVHFSEYFLWKAVTSFQKYRMANAGSQVFSSSK